MVKTVQKPQLKQPAFSRSWLSVIFFALVNCAPIWFCIMSLFPGQARIVNGQRVYIDRGKSTAAVAEVPWMFARLVEPMGIVLYLFIAIFYFVLNYAQANNSRWYMNARDYKDVCFALVVSAVICMLLVFIMNAFVGPVFR